MLLLECYIIILKSRQREACHHSPLPASSNSSHLETSLLAMATSFLPSVCTSFVSSLAAFPVFSFCSGLSVAPAGLLHMWVTARIFYFEFIFFNLPYIWVPGEWVLYIDPAHTLLHWCSGSSMTDLDWHFSVLAAQPYGVWLRGANNSFFL